VIPFVFVPPVDAIPTLAQRCYGDKEELDYSRLSRDEVISPFRELGLTGEFWDVHEDWS
jgi:hypothetical protein